MHITTLHHPIETENREMKKSEVESKKKMSNSHEQEENEALSRAAKATELLYQLRDRYFPSNPQEKTSKLLDDSNRILKLIDSIPREERSLPMQLAKIEYLRGKLLDVTDDYRKEAEDHLSKAVKLNPSLADAWLCLSNCISKKGDSEAVNQCLDLALTKVGHDVDENILRQLLMLKGKFVDGVENQEEIADESIQHARDAIALDVKDGNSCYCAALGYMISCFVSGCMDGKMLIKSFKAFEDVGKMEKNPKYSYNCALIAKYIGNYEIAVPLFGAIDRSQINSIIDIHNQLKDIEDKEYALNSENRSLELHEEVTESFRRAFGGRGPTKDFSLTDLKLGHNRGRTVLGDVKAIIRGDLGVSTYLLCDSKRTGFILLVYGAQETAIKVGDNLKLTNPYYQINKFDWEGKTYSSKAIFLESLECLKVNGKLLQEVQILKCPIPTFFV